MSEGKKLSGEENEKPIPEAPESQTRRSGPQEAANEAQTDGPVRPVKNEPGAARKEENVPDERRYERRKSYKEFLSLIRTLLTPIRSKGKLWLKSPSNRYLKCDSGDGTQLIKGTSYKLTGELLADDQCKSIKEILQFDETLQKVNAVHQRVARVGDTYYIDNVGPSGDVLKVEPAVDGNPRWALMPDCAGVYFSRPSSQEALPAPTRGGSVDDLREFFRTKSEDDFKRLVVFCFGLFACPDVGVPALHLTGPEGSGKSTAAEMLGQLVDPAAELHSPPLNVSAAEFAASCRYLAIFDNLTGIRKDVSDTLCTLVSGTGAVSQRKLYADGDVYRREFGLCRLVFTGIGNLGEKADLRSRMLVVRMAKSCADKGSPDLKADFEKALPLIIGTFADALSMSLANEDRTYIAVSRFQPWERRCVATESFFGWPPGTVRGVLERHSQQSNEDLLDDRPFSRVLVDRMQSDYPDGTGSQPWSIGLEDLAQKLGQPQWSAKTARSELQRDEALLSKYGVTFEQGPRPAAEKGKRRHRIYLFSYKPKKES